MLLGLVFAVHAIITNSMDVIIFTAIVIILWMIITELQYHHPCRMELIGVEQANIIGCVNLLYLANLVSLGTIHK